MSLPKIKQINEDQFVVVYWNFLKPSHVETRDDDGNVFQCQTYELLNLDVSYETVYHHQGKWYLQKYSTFDTNHIYRCQSGCSYTYEILLSDLEEYDLKMKYVGNIYDHLCFLRPSTFDKYGEAPAGLFPDDKIWMLLTQPCELGHTRMEFYQYTDELMDYYLKFTDVHYDQDLEVLHICGFPSASGMEREVIYRPLNLQQWCCGAGDYFFISCTMEELQMPLSTVCKRFATECKECYKPISKQPDPYIDLCWNCKKSLKMEA